MTKTRTLLGLCLVLVALAAAAWLFSRRSTPEATLRKLNNVSRFSVRFKNVDAEFTKTSALWEIERFGTSAVRDRRANQSLVSHLYDLVRVIDPGEFERFSATEADNYTKDSILSVRWADEIIVFGNRDVTGRLAYVHFSDRELLTKARTHVLTLMEPRIPLDMRDRRVTTFDLDDVEDFSTSKDCHGYSLHRDGDRWAWKSSTRPSAKDLEEWLEAFLKAHYEEIDEAAMSGTQFVCQIELKGRRNRAETISVFRRDGKLWAANSALPAVYRIPDSYLELLKGHQKRAGSKSAAGF